MSTTPNPGVPNWLQVMELLMRMTETLIEHFETGRSFNPTDMRIQHSLAKQQLAAIYEQIAQGGPSNAPRN